ncbi:unnamed protein product [Pocillopora meandrina]|uniref:Uncharacterized protein n=1 Tax=Pocillopora meandrina TaxID=46732 RepID=A0AAU9Y671_9CNID|nr:unnamed protein product [Pocillopora meandrina]
MEKVIQLQYTQAGQSGRGHLTVGEARMLFKEQKQFKGRGLTENRAVDCAAKMDQSDHQPKNRFKRLIEEDFVDKSSEIYYIYLQPLSNTPAPTATITTGQMEKRLLNLEREVQQIKASLEHVKKELRTSSTVPAGTCSPNSVLARVKCRTSHELNQIQMSKTLCSPSLAFDSAHGKCGTLKHGNKEVHVCFESRESTCSMMKDAILPCFDIRHMLSKIQKYRQAIIDACNQKCREVARKEAGSALKCTNDTDNSRQ